jgi:ATP-dependent Zn protease
MTCVLVQRHRNSVELVANMLLTRRTLDGREIDRLCEMSRHAR